jgi:four helix bundle protein
VNKNGNNLIVDLSYSFALNIIPFSDILTSDKRSVMANQLSKSGTSTGANIREAQSSESKTDFIHKMKVASKEAEETDYWLMLAQPLGYDVKD